MASIKIGKPYIIESNSRLNSKGSRLCAEVCFINPNLLKEEKRILFYEVDYKYTKYLCDENSDAFVSGLLTTAMENGYDIEFEKPISERLYYQLTSYYIPMVSSYNKGRVRPVKLIGETTNIVLKSEGAVATGCSGGVDSFYTITRHGKGYITPKYELTHILFASCGTLDNKTDRIEDYYINQFPRMEMIAEKIGCEAIGCYSNIHEFYKFPYEGFSMFYATIYGSVVYALQKLIGIYYVSSGAPISKFTLDIDKASGHDASVFDIFTLNCMSTDSVTFYSTGSEKSRLEKTEYIAANPVAQKYLTVCVVEANGGSLDEKCNCGVCAKCLRTMVQLYATGNLDNFSEVFDLKDFYDNKNKRIGKMLATNKSAYVRDTIEAAKKHNVSISFKCYLWNYLVYKPVKLCAVVLRNSVIIRKIYYYFKLDIIMHGYRDSRYDAFNEKH